MRKYRCPHHRMKKAIEMWTPQAWKRLLSF
nr:MAG TPA: hypothetical protein [Caudoviricetes sp.]